MSIKAEQLAQKKCEAWACWKELSELEKEEVFDDYMEMYELGKSETGSEPLSK